MLVLVKSPDLALTRSVAMHGLHAWLAIEGGSGGATLCRAAGPWAARAAEALSEPVKKCKGQALGQGAVPGIFTSCLSLQSRRKAEMWSGTHSQPDPYQTVTALSLLLVTASHSFWWWWFGMTQAAPEEQRKLPLPRRSIHRCLDDAPSLPQLISSLTRPCM